MQCKQLESSELLTKPKVSNDKSIASFVQFELQRLTSKRSYPSTYLSALATNSWTRYRNKTQQIQR